MKKVAALLAAVMILAGSVGMTASAATTACEHLITWRENGTDYIETYTHSVQVGTSASGKPIMAACLVEIKWRPYKNICFTCGNVAEHKEKIYELHSMH